MEENICTTCKTRKTPPTHGICVVCSFKMFTAFSTGSITPEFVEAVRDALWWVQSGLDSADLNNIEHRRTLRCRDVLELFLSNK